MRDLKALRQRGLSIPALRGEVFRPLEPHLTIIGIFGVLAWINVPYQFSRKIGSAGGFYEFVSQGFGRRLGTFTGYLYLFSYFNTITNAVLFVGGVFLPSMLSDFFGVSLPRWSWIPITLVFLALITLPAYLGIRPSARYSLYTSIIEISLLVVFSAVLLVKFSSRLSLAPFTPGPAHGWAPVFEGMILAIFSMSGSSAAVYIAEETRDPLKNVKKAVLVSFLITGVVFVLTSYAMVVAWGLSNMSTFASSGVPGLILAKNDVGVWFLVLLLAFTLNSLVAGSLAPLNSSSRLLYALARDGAAPAWLAEVHPTRRTPHKGILLLSGLSAVVILAAGLTMGPFNGFLFLINASAIALFVGHMLGDVALPFFYRRLGEVNIVYHIIAPIVSFVILLFGVYFSFYPPAYPINVAAIVTGVFAIVVAAMIAAGTIKVSPPATPAIRAPVRGSQGS
jgi:amino acid transporter